MYDYIPTPEERKVILESGVFDDPKIVEKPIIEEDVSTPVVKENIISTGKPIKAGDKCLVWGKKGTPDNGKIRYYALTTDNSHYFMNDKTKAITASRGSLMSSFLGATSSLQNWRNFKVIEEVN